VNQAAQVAVLRDGAPEGQRLLDSQADLIAVKWLGDKVKRAAPQDFDSWSGRELWSPCFKTIVVGTTGAGDATIAGFLAALLRGQSPEESITMACAVGACNVEASDALGGVQSWNQTQSRISAGWPRLPLPMEMRDWRWDKTNGLWSGPRDGHRAASRL